MLCSEMKDKKKKTLLWFWKTRTHVLSKMYDLKFATRDSCHKD